jgi:hypothetical protein
VYLLVGDRARSLSGPVYGCTLARRAVGFRARLAGADLRPVGAAWRSGTVS